jgi:hypothetical protein
MDENRIINKKDDFPISKERVKVLSFPEESDSDVKRVFNTERDIRPIMNVNFVVEAARKETHKNF